MGFLEGSCLNTGEPPNSSTSDDLSTATFRAKDQYFEHDYERKMKAFWSKMFWQFGLACLVPNESDETSKESNKKNADLEHNKAWLLAESGGCGSAELTNADPQSVHSSFRSSLCSQVELESMNMNSSATVLMVNLDNGLNETRAKELKWRRIQSLERSISPVANSLVRFSYSEILAATNNFSKGRVLGRGALSFVFRGKVGFLRTAVAIKRLDKEDKEASKAFCRELMIASSLYHSNIVPLVGFCIDPDEGLFLVYRYVSGGNLERHLHDKKKGKGGVKGSSGLPWSVRYKVALGIAQAIAYLHNGTERCVVHRDIKPSNILLSSKKVPKLCDFGLATWTSAPSVPFLCKTVKGTFGYLAPEYFQHGKISDKTDVYAFGVVLLELISGRKPIEARKPLGEENLVLWAKPLLQKGKEAIEELLDPRLKCTLRNTTQITQMIQAAAACISNEESRRPGIDEIIGILRGEEQPIYSNRKKSNFSGIIDCYHQLQQTKSEMNSHLALAMLGVSEFEDDDHLYCR
ncbi:PREDICTED: serine/threonine-protein kinase CDL1-like [Populus euphratica]|uniref:Serine/threonine-protein kinase CDL1-like n=1 Tax=Populus euphratica TaxID=75702 RepID=A0AAJ6T1A6_POPEU|nr:PREDICTED: serine/threonine-protein kinase CDL1-like [Populus euphratica]